MRRYERVAMLVLGGTMRCAFCVTYRHFWGWRSALRHRVAQARHSVNR